MAQDDFIPFGSRVPSPSAPPPAAGPERRPPSDYWPAQSTPPPEPPSFLETLFEPEIAQYRAAGLPGAIRLAPLVIPGGPLASTLTGLAAEGLAGYLESGNPFHRPLNLALSGLPLAIAGAGKVGPALSRTATRLFPGRFDRQHRAAQEALGDVIESFGSPAAEQAAWEVFDQMVTQHPGASIPLAATPARAAEMQRSLQTSFGTAAPRFAGTEKTLQQFHPLTRPGAIPVYEANIARQQLNDIAASIPEQAPAARRLVNALIEDIGTAAQSGAVGSEAAQALQAANRASQGKLAAETLTGLQAKATRVNTGEYLTPALHVARFEQLVQDPKAQRELTRWLTPEQRAELASVIHRWANLPPETPWRADKGIMAALNLPVAFGWETFGNLKRVKGNPFLTQLAVPAGQIGRVALPPALEATLPPEVAAELGLAP